MDTQRASDQPQRGDIIVDTGLLKIEEVRGPDRPRQKGLREYVEEGTVKALTGDQVIYRLKEVGSAEGAPSTNAAAADSSTVSQPHVAVLGSPHVPVGVSSALGYLQLGQKAVVKVAPDLMTHAVADDTAALKPVPKEDQFPVTPAPPPTSPARSNTTGTYAAAPGTARETYGPTAKTSSAPRDVPGQHWQQQQYCVDSNQFPPTPASSPMVGVGGTAGGTVVLPGQQQQQQRLLQHQKSDQRNEVNISYPHSSQQPMRRRSRSPTSSMGSDESAAAAAAAAALMAAVPGGTTVPHTLPPVQLEPIPSEEHLLNCSASNHSSWLADSRHSSSGDNVAVAAARHSPPAAAVTTAPVVSPGTGSSSTAGAGSNSSTTAYKRDTTAATVKQGKDAATYESLASNDVAPFSELSNCDRSAAVAGVSGSEHTADVAGSTAVQQGLQSPSGWSSVRSSTDRSTQQQQHDAILAPAAAAAASDGSQQQQQEGYHTPVSSTSYFSAVSTPGSSFSMGDSPAVPVTVASPAASGGQPAAVVGFSPHSTRSGFSPSDRSATPMTAAAAARVAKVDPSKGKGQGVSGPQPEALLKAAAAKLQTECSSSTAEQQQQRRDASPQQQQEGDGKLSVRERAMRLEQQQQQQLIRMGSATTSSKVVSPTAAAITKQQQQQPYPDMDVLHKPVPAPAAPPAAAAATTSASPALPAVQLLGHDQDNSSKSPLLRPVAAAAATSAASPPAHSAGWGELVGARQQQHQQQHVPVRLTPTRHAAANGAAAEWGRTISQHEQQAAVAPATAGTQVGSSSSSRSADVATAVGWTDSTSQAKPPRGQQELTADTGSGAAAEPRRTSNVSSGVDVASFRAWVGSSSTAEPSSPVTPAAKTAAAVAAAAAAMQSAPGAEIVAVERIGGKDIVYAPKSSTATGEYGARDQNQQTAAAAADQQGTSTTAAAAAAGPGAEGAQGNSSDQDKKVEYELEVLAIVPGRGKLSGQPVLSEAAQQQHLDVKALTHTAAKEEPHLKPPKPLTGCTGWIRRHLSLNVAAPYRAGKQGASMLGIRGCFKGKNEKQQ